MEFIGQSKIVEEIKYLLEDVNNGNNHNVLFRAPSGFGKTTLGLICLNYLGLDDSYYYIPNNEGTINFDAIRQKRFHFIDEIHTLKNPEVLYPFLDSGRFTFFLASNESGSLKEPLINRCIPFIFEPYSDAELLLMTEKYLAGGLSKEFAEEITRRCKRNPRIIKVTCTRINYIIKNHRSITLDEFIRILDEILQIDRIGLNAHDRIYLEYLDRVGGQASLTTISNGTGLDKNLILSEIEPGLLYLGIIKINSKGRQLA